MRRESSPLLVDVVADDDLDDDDPTTSSLDVRVTFTQLLSLAKREWDTLLFGTLSLLVRLPFSVSMPHFTSVAIGASIDGDEARFRANVTRFLVVGVVNGVLDFSNVFLFALAQSRVARRLRNRAFAATLRKNMAYFDARTSGKINSTVTNDTSAVSANLSWLLRSCVEAVVRCVGVGAYLLFWVNFELGALALVVIPITSVVNYFYGKLLSANAESVQETLAKSNGVAQETISNIVTVRSFANEPFERRRFGDAIDEWYEQSYRAAQLSGWYYSFMYSLVSACFVPAAILYVGGGFVVDGSMHAEKLVATMLYSAILQEYFGNLLSSFTNLFAARGAAAELFKVLAKNEREDDDADNGATLPIDDVKGAISFSNVSFSYPTRPDIPALSGVSFDVSPGEIIGIVGRSGCGKSTVFALLQRFYTEFSGDITLDGARIETLSPNWLRRHCFALVGQEPVLFNGTILSNIAYARLGAGIDRERAIECAKTALIHDVIEDELGGYDTHVGERGCQLSGGQKQRVAIARALYSSPRVLLLDEPTSALDLEAESIVTAALRKAARGRTTIVISHTPVDSFVDRTLELSPRT